MIYKVITGHDKGKFIIASEIDEVEGMVTADNGKKYFIENVKEATDQEIKENSQFKVTKIF